MPISVTARVAALIAEASRVERESESVYLELGRLFPRLSAEMEKSADNGERSIRALAALASSGLDRSDAASDFFIKDAAAYFASLRERDSDFLAKINDGISRLGAIDQIIARVRADSEEMEIISLNAMTVALKSGGEGKAFSVITDELKRLSGRTIALTEGVTANGKILLEFFARLRAALAELEGFQKGFFDAIDKTLGSGYAELGQGLSAATSFFSTLLGEARSVRDPVLRVMNEIQLQDIVRQSLQHVGISLEEARAVSAAGAGEAGGSVASTEAFVAAVAELSSSLIDDIVAKLDASAATFGSDMAAVSGIVGESERKRREFLASAGHPLEADADSSGFRDGTGRYLELKRDVVSMSSRLAENVGKLDASFKGLAALLSRFQNIVVASRIEVAKTKALAGVATTVGGMITLTERIEADVAEAMESTKGFNALSSGAIAGYAQGGDAGDERLVSTLEAVSAGIERLSLAKASMRGAIDDFSLYTEAFIALIGRADEELSKLRGLTDSLRGVGSTLDELRDSIRAYLGPEASRVEPDRMRRMVERFTIFTHKKAAGDIGRFAVEEGGEAGQVTLF
jgi:hypothetical protein